VADALLPGILKTARMGYDGKGQVRVRTRGRAGRRLGRPATGALRAGEAAAAAAGVLGHRGARCATATCVHLPVQRNLHRDGILAVTEVYDGQSAAGALSQQAHCRHESIAEGLAYVGVLCVEFFVLDCQPDAQAWAAWSSTKWRRALTTAATTAWTPAMCRSSSCRCAPWPACRWSQPRQHSPCHHAEPAGRPVARQASPDLGQVLALPGAHLHLYGKLQASKGRKMGHLTLTGATVAEVQANALCRPAAFSAWRPCRVLRPAP